MILIIKMLMLNKYILYRLATSPVNRRNDMFHLRCSQKLRLGHVIRSNHFGRSPSINILILLRLNLLCRTVWRHFILVPIRHWRFTERKRVAGTGTQNAAVLGSTGLVSKQWRTAGRIPIYLLLKIIIMGGRFQVQIHSINNLLKFQKYLIVKTWKNMKKKS